MQTATGRTTSIYEPRGFPQAARTLAPWQAATLAAMALLLPAALWLRPGPVLLWLNILAGILYFASTAYRLLLIDLSLRHAREISIPDAEVRALADADCPRYLVLVPLYREAEVLPHLVRGLERLDYPADRLEIRLLVEADDSETMDAAALLTLPPQFRVVTIPPSLPRTKPKACNVGMQGSDADFVVIYDAEDRPEPDQLKKAVLAFRRLPPEIACIQAKLNFYNPHQNFLTRCFTAEYATWFDLCLPGLDCLRAPIPLGGTSNHFPLRTLREIGGWDEFNVTEDCDLGLRLFRRGWRTRILDSTTWEQACPSLHYWIRQRSRWVKGYVQTYLVHMRSPLGLLRQLGLRNWLHFQLLIGGAPLCQLINPLYWLMAVLWFFIQPAGLDAFFPGPVFAMAAFCLFAGNFIFAYTSAIACVRRGFGSLAVYGLAMPVYWVLMSFGAWKGVLQLFKRPHFWEKTRHFENPEAAPPPAPAPASKAGGNPARPPAAAPAASLPPAATTAPQAQASPGGRPLGVLWLLAVLTVLRLFLPFAAPGAAAVVHDSIAQALLNQLNWGRQALVASLEFPPLQSLGLFLTEAAGRIVGLSGLRLLTALCQALTFCYILRSPQTGPARLRTAAALVLAMALPGMQPLLLAPNPGWLLTALAAASVFHLLQWQRQPALRDEIVAGVCCGLLLFGGPAGILTALLLLGLFSLLITTRNAATKRQGALLLLWAPAAYCLLLLFIGNWLLIQDAFYPWHAAAAVMTAPDAKAAAAQLASWAPLFTVALLALAMLAPRRPDDAGRLAAGLGLLLIVLASANAGLPALGLECAGGGLLLFWLAWQLLVVPLCWNEQDENAPGWRRLAWLGIFAAALLLGARIPAPAVPADAGRRGAPSAAEITAFIDTQWSEGRIAIYGLQTPAAFPDPLAKRFLPRLDFSEAELLAQAEDEVMHLLLPPPAAGFYPPAGQLADIHRRGRPWLLLEKTWASGWQLWRCVIMPETPPAAGSSRPASTGPNP